MSTAVIALIIWFLFVIVLLYCIYPIITCDLPWSRTQYDWRIGTMLIKQNGEVTKYYVIEHKIRAKFFPTKWRYKGEWDFRHYDEEYGTYFWNKFKTLERAQKYLKHLYEDQKPIITEINGKRKYDYGLRCRGGDMDF